LVVLGLAVQQGTILVHQVAQLHFQERAFLCPLLAGLGAQVGQLALLLCLVLVDKAELHLAAG
jgi:hypothetical protein